MRRRCPKHKGPISNPAPARGAGGIGDVQFLDVIPAHPRHAESAGYRKIFRHLRRLCTCCGQGLHTVQTPDGPASPARCAESRRPCPGDGLALPRPRPPPSKRGLGIALVLRLTTRDTSNVGFILGAALPKRFRNGDVTLPPSYRMRVHRGPCVNPALCRPHANRLNFQPVAGGGLRQVSMPGPRAADLSRSTRAANAQRGLDERWNSAQAPTGFPQFRG